MNSKWLQRKNSEIVAFWTYLDVLIGDAESQMLYFWRISDFCISKVQKLVHVSIHIVLS